MITVTGDFYLRMKWNETFESRLQWSAGNINLDYIMKSDPDVHFLFQESAPHAQRDPVEMENRVYSRSKSREE